MAITDIYEIVHRMTVQNKKMVTVFHVERSSGVETAGSISDAFQNSILPIIRLLQNTGVTNDEIFVFNLGTTTDFGTFTLSAAAGLRAGAFSPTFISGAIRFPSLDRDIRSGHKRFNGMLESDYTTGVIIAASLVLLDNIGDAMIGGWLSSVDSHLVCEYIIVKRVCETTDPVTGKCLEYRLPKIESELKFYEPNSRITNPEIASQVSRKVF